MTRFEQERQLLHRMHVFINDPTDFHHRYLDEMIHKCLKDAKYEAGRRRSFMHNDSHILPRDIR